MSLLHQLPSWDGVHPLIVHFPIALLLVAPLFMLIALLLPIRGRAFGYAALVLMVLGTTAAVVAKETGEAAAKLVERGDKINPVLAHHEELAEAVVISFGGLTILYAAALVLQHYVPKLRQTWIHTAIHAGLLVVFVGACLVLAKTGHEGGRMVHQMGVTAMMPPED